MLTAISLTVLCHLMAKSELKSQLLSRVQMCSFWEFGLFFYMCVFKKLHGAHMKPKDLMVL